MKKSVLFFLFSLLAISILLFTSCKQSDYYKWINFSTGGQYQWTRGKLRINNEVKTAKLEVYITFIDNQLNIKFWKQARYFEENETRISLVNNEANIDDETTDYKKEYDYIKSSFSNDPNSLVMFENKDGNMSKDNDGKVLILSPTVSGTIRQNILSGKGSDITFKDGEYVYTFRIYKQGLKM